MEVGQEQQAPARRKLADVYAHHCGHKKAMFLDKRATMA
jgi:hypothetical protein